MGELGPYSGHLKALNTLDGRTKEARLLKAFRQELCRLLGRKPNAAELAMIERVSFLHLRICSLEKEMIDGTMSGFDRNVYNAHLNSFARALQRLGVLGDGAKRYISQKDIKSIKDIMQARANVKRNRL